MTAMEQRKRARLECIDNEMERRKQRSRSEGTDEVELCPSDMSDIVSLPSAVTSAPRADRAVPKGFLCPLTMDIMYDPVLDPEGNTYERKAIMEWLRHKRNSPVSRQPLNDKMLIPNNALRETIHEFMGSDWSDRKSDVSGVTLCLNDEGHCIFQYENIAMVLYVPEKVGVFCFYTRQLVPMVTDSMKDRILELNFLQGETRGGCLSTTRHIDGHSEVLFSYSDRVPEVTGDDFRIILFNFVETAASLRKELMMYAHADKLRIPQPMLGAPPAPAGICRNSQAPPQA